MSEAMDIKVLPAFEDNYIYLICNGHDSVVVDPGENDPVDEYLSDHPLKLRAVFCTHHHQDHIGGSRALRDKYGCEIYGFKGDSYRIPCLTRKVSAGDVIEILGTRFQVLEIPGHTLGHIAYYSSEENILFCGDTLFAAGCGRVFEGTYEQIWNSLKTMAALPVATKIYCGHEYTLDNLRFALSIDPNHPATKARYETVKSLRAQNLPTLPTTLEIELETNPFLRARDVKEFAKLRKQKDQFV